ncbi:MAG: hypothetical protein QOJ75_1813 [Chloroflexota bacterium]|jgi:hypothetical protein|nr:hypothetical protein [Chloroflexota bacterium]
MVIRPPTVDAIGMLKRLASGPLWFIAIWALVELFESATGSPRLIGPVAGAAAAAFVLLDPFALFWPRSEPRTRELNTKELVGASPSH